MAYRTSAEAKAGSQRMRQIAIGDRAETDREVARLLESLGREPSPGEAIDAELIATAYVRSKRLRMQGRSDIAERQELGKLMRTTVFGLIPVPPPTPPRINPVGPRSPGKAFFVAEKGDDDATDGMTVADNPAPVNALVNRR